MSKKFRAKKAEAAQVQAVDTEAKEIIAAATEPVAEPKAKAEKKPAHNAKVLSYVAAVREALGDVVANKTDHEIATTKQLWRCATKERAVQYAKEAFLGK